MSFRVLDAEFVCSATDPTVGAGWPDDDTPEIGFVGRSNVGKSTLLQALTGRRGLVRTSSNPGRTRLINFFLAHVADGKSQARTLRLVDLPGYGYAKVSKAEREEWLPFVEKYFTKRDQLKAVVLLMDIRRGAELDETELIKFLTGRGVAVICVVTKADKLSKHERKPATEIVRAQLIAAGLAKDSRGLKVPVLAVSGTTSEGLDELLRRLDIALVPPSV